MKKLNQKYNQCAGFTLFELLVSISIIAVLTVLATVSFSGAQKKARDSRRVQDMKAIQTAAEMYYSKNNSTYPVNTGEFTSGGVLQSWPVDPKSPTYSYTFAPLAVAGDDYCACAFMEGLTNGNAALGCANFGSATTHYCVKNQQ